MTVDLSAIDLIHALNVPMLILDAKGSVENMNPAAEKLFGRQLNEIQGEHFVELSSVSTSKETKTKFKAALEKGGAYSEQFILADRKKNPLLVQISFSVLKDEKELTGKTIAVILDETSDIVERKAADTALQESEERFRLFFQNAPVYCYMISPKGIIIDVNESALNALGYTKDDLVGRSYLDLYSTEDILKVRGELAGYQKSECVENLELSILTKSGAKRDVILSVNTIRDSGENILHSISIQQDITEIKKFREALQKSEQRFRGLFEQSLIAIEIYDYNGNLVDANPATLDLFGVSNLSEVTGFKLFDDPNVTTEVKERLRKGETVRYNTEFDFEKVKKLNLYNTSRSGTIFIDLTIAPMTIREGKQNEFYIVFVDDMTEAYTAQQTLIKSEQQYRSVLSSLQDMIFVFDKDDKYTQYHCLDDSLLYVPPEQVIGNHISEVLTLNIDEDGKELAKHTVDTFLNSMATVRETGGPFTIDYPLDIEEKTHWFSAQLTLHEDGESIVAVVRDTTQKKETEQALNASEKQMKALFKGIPVSTYTWKRVEDDFLLDDFNDMVQESTEGKISDLTGVKASELHKEEPELLEMLHTTFNEKRNQSKELLYTYKSSGKSAYLNTTLVYVPPDLVMIHADDITERKHAEMVYRRVNRSLAALSGSNEAIIKATSEEELFNSVCHVLVETAGYRLAWIGKAVHNEKKDVTPVAQAGFEEGYLDTLNISWDDIKRGQGPTGVAIRTGKSCISQDITKDPKFKPWREDARTRGYASSIAIPLRYDSGYFGALNIYAKESNAFDSAEIEFLEKMGESISYAIKSLRTQVIVETERKQAEADVKFERERLVSVLDALIDGIYVVSKNYDIEYVNKVIERKFGPVADRKCYEHLHERKEPCPWCKNEEVFAGNSVRWEWYSEKNDRHYDLLDVPIKNADGSLSKFEIFRDITEGKKIEAERIRAEEEWKETFDNLTDLASIHDNEFRILKVNKTFADYFGKDPEELEGRFCYEVLHGTKEPWPNCPHVRTMESKKSVTEEVDDARIGIPLLVSTSPILDEDGNIERVIHIARDISPVKKSQESLEESEKRYRTLVEASFDGIFIHIDFIIQTLNQQVADILDSNIPDLIGKSIFDLFTPESQKRIRDNISSDQNAPYVIMRIRDDGSVQIIETVGRQCSYEGKEARIVAFKDITDRVKSEEAIIASERRYRSLYERMEDGFSIADKEGKYLAFNKAYLRMLGYSETDLANKSFIDITPEKWHETDNIIFQTQVQIVGYSQLYEKELIKKDGTLVPIEVRVHMTYDEEGVPAGTWALIRDISQRKESEIELQRSAEAALLYLDIMGHDVRNHLQAIVMATEIMNSSEMSPEFVSIYDIITESVENSQNLINKVRLTRGLLQAPLHEISLSQTLSQCIEEVSKNNPDVHIEIEHEVKNAMIEGDEYAGIVFQNILDNSVKFNPSDIKQIWISSIERDNDYEISIADNGAGITDDRKQSLFIPEKRFVGVGIYQVKFIVTKYNGSISVQDRITGDSSQGAKFVLLIPKVSTPEKEGRTR